MELQPREASPGNSEVVAQNTSSDRLARSALGSLSSQTVRINHLEAGVVSLKVRSGNTGLWCMRGHGDLRPTKEGSHAGYGTSSVLS